jgi:hypothetical protein
MISKKHLLIGAVLLLAGFLAWRSLERTPTEADDPNRPAAGTAQATAAVARAERRNLGNTLTIAGEFSNVTISALDRS